MGIKEFDCRAWTTQPGIFGICCLLVTQIKTFKRLIHKDKDKTYKDKDKDLKSVLKES